MQIFKSIIDFLTSLFDSKQKSIPKNHAASKNIYWSKSDIKLIAGAAQRFVEIINESLQIAKQTKNIETKISRVRLARQKLNDLIEYVNKYPFIKIEKLHEVDLNIKEFEAEIENHIKPTFNSQNTDDIFYRNGNLVKGLIFQAYPYLETPLSILIHHGERFLGPPSKVPRYGSGEYGGWSPLLITWRELGIDIDEFPEGTVASKFGPVKASEYIPFLIEFRKIIEGKGSIDEKISNVIKLGESNNQYKKYFSIINYFKEHRGDFPKSFFYNQFTVIPGVGTKSAKALFEAGIKTYDDLKNAYDKTLLAIPGIGPVALKKIREFFEKDYNNPLP